MRRGLIIFACALVGALAQAPEPARLQRGTLPSLPPMAVGGGQVFLQLAIDRTGRVADVVPLRTTPPFTSLMTEAVREWTFRPAEESGQVGSAVLVAALFRPPSSGVPTLGEMPRDVGTGSPAMPFPVVAVTPAYPPHAYMGGIVLLEARVNRLGAVVDATVLRSARPFDAAAQAAARQWRFRPAQRQDGPVSAIVYLVFGFPVPVT
jgi:TonB family protein